MATAEEVCRLAAVSRTFRSGVNSDVVWLNFLPVDWELMVSSIRSSEVPSWLVFTAVLKKDLFYLLCRQYVHLHPPIFPDHYTSSVYDNLESVKVIFVTCSNDAFRISYNTDVGNYVCSLLGVQVQVC
ncbi:F-box protein PP2-B10-like [Momordica charantia]|uniref:F-box protein PP2-B10-like n=1 Tax=Momordica charantia TaxID=3673 RepID=A0A6J1CCX5_MOMCH|nr:F-box protein PP2-B10-like [Momordica charantia]